MKQIRSKLEASTGRQNKIIHSTYAKTKTPKATKHKLEANTSNQNKKLNNT